MRRADRGENQRNLVAFHQAPCLLDRLGRRIAIVERDQVDLAPIDAAALVDHLEVPDLALAERAEGGYRAAIGHGLADLDLGRRDAAHFGAAGCKRPCRQGQSCDDHKFRAPKSSQPKSDLKSRESPHLFPPLLVLKALVTAEAVMAVSSVGKDDTRLLGEQFGACPVAGNVVSRFQDAVGCPAFPRSPGRYVSMATQRIPPLWQFARWRHVSEKLLHDRSQFRSRPE